MKKQELINLKNGDIVYHSKWHECKVKTKDLTCLNSHHTASVDLIPTDKHYQKLIKICIGSDSRYNLDRSYTEDDWQMKIKIKK